MHRGRAALIIMMQKAISVQYNFGEHLAVWPSVFADESERVISEKCARDDDDEPQRALPRQPREALPAVSRLLRRRSTAHIATQLLASQVALRQTFATLDCGASRGVLRHRLCYYRRHL